MNLYIAAVGSIPVDDSDSSSNLSQKLQDAFEKLIQKQSVDSFEEMATKKRVIVTLDKLLALFSGVCSEKDCGREKMVWHRFQGSVLIVGWSCDARHGGCWESSEVLVQKARGPKIYVNDVVLAASIILSGNNLSKIAHLAKCINLNFISDTSIFRTQKLYVIPSVQKFWSDMKTAIHEILKEGKMVLSGDGRNDSPGFCAQYCVYSLMESVTKVIVDLEVKDKRETGGSSTTMEVAALKCLLERLAQKITIDELTTDASSSVIGMVKKLKGKVYI